FPGSAEGPLSWSPDGARVAYRQTTTPREFGYGGGFGTVALAPASGGEPKLLAAGLDRPITASRWARDGRSIVGLVADDMRQYPVRVRLDGSGVDRVPCDVPVLDALASRAQGGLAVIGSSTTRPPELYALDARGTRHLTHHNA